jgi:Domain of unknown function (DUF1918)
MRAHVGDRLIIEGDEARTGLIIGVPHADGSPPYIVKWLADGHIAMVSPGDFARLIPAAHAPSRAPSESAADSSRRMAEQRSDVVRHECL